MPCYDSGPRGDGVSYSELKEVKDKLDLVTSLLCELTEELDIDKIKSPALKLWVKEHREFDAKRKKKQSLNDVFKETYKGKIK